MMTIRRARQLVADWLEPLTPEATALWDERDTLMSEVQDFLCAGAESAASVHPSVAAQMGIDRSDATEDLEGLLHRWSLDQRR